MKSQCLKDFKVSSARKAFRLFSQWMPHQAANVVYSQMFRPTPFRYREKDLKALESGHLLKIQCEGFQTPSFQIASWSWEPLVEKFSKPKRALLVHGWAGAGVQFKDFVEPLRQAGFHVTMIDLPAHGFSSGSKTHLPANIKVLMQILEHFDDTKVVVAHSFGATATCVALRWGAALDKVVLYAPMADLSEGLFRALHNQGTSRNVFERIRTRAEETFNLSWNKMSPVCFSHELSTPALIIHDRDDSDVDVSQSERLQMMWPKSKLRVTEGLGHFRVLKNKELIEETVHFITE